MLTYKEAFYNLKQQLQPLYDEHEAAAISHEVLEFITSFGKTDRLFKKDTILTDSQQQVYDQATASLLAGRPLQYVTGRAWFLGQQYLVNEHVLIPRPETEELVHWIITDYKKRNTPLSILDVGTGSGCIPISLKLGLPQAHVTSCDISQGALDTAATNAARLAAEVSFIQMDFLDTALQNKLATFDVIVSNPPYIPLREKEKLHMNVRNYEPGIALFVPDDDALVFYRAIAIMGKTHLSGGGCIYCETDAHHTEACKSMFEALGYSQVEARKDMHGNWRMIQAQL